MLKLKGMYPNKRILIFILISFIILSILTSSKILISYYSTEQSARIALAKQYLAIAETIANGLDKEGYQQFLLTQTKDDENFTKTKRYLEEYRSRINALYVYVLLLDDSDVSKTMVAAVPSVLQELPIGAPCTVPAAQVSQAKKGQNYFTSIIKGERDEAYFSVGVPFYDENGEILGVIGIDIDAKDLELVSLQVIKSSEITFAIDVLFAIALITVVFFLNKWYRLRLKQDLKDSEKIFIVELGNIVATLKSSRHDLMNHLQVLNGLMQLKLYDKTSDYLKQITLDSKAMDLSLQVKNPILMVLFQSKWELAQSKNIRIQFEIDQSNFNRIESMDLVKIISNLLDNAIEAADIYEGSQPKLIRIICKTVGSKYTFSIENPTLLSVKEQKNLFQIGYTTKGNGDGVRGNGLSIIKRTVEKYHGDINVHYEQEIILIQITI
ncbi:GHKL domain-containing protein [Paenibacillus gorillae]|uniref:GHKL domain-containing protein n=1 Tax=Paenibacillus gorillae TaxID=1243662 RepID=UPI0005A790DC|nr:GHKL domain-containing protein [Paenibacillus gorillae]